MPAAQALDSEWTLTGQMSTPRVHHTATLLPNGRVLIVGDNGSIGGLVESKVYDPVSGTWSAGGNLNAERELVPLW